MVVGTVKSYNPHKGWGFVEFNGKDIFVMKKELGGVVVDKGQEIEFDFVENEKGLQATNIKALVLGPESFYSGEIKSYSPKSGWGFVASEAFPNQDIFVMKSDLPGGFGPQGAYCKFKMETGEKGPVAKSVSFLGAASNHVKGAQMMDMWSLMAMGKGKGKGKFFPFGKGMKGGKGGAGGPDQPRTVDSEEMVTGVVLEWKGKFGWIQPDVSVEDNPLAKKHGGKIFIAKQDLVGVEELESGSKVSYVMYSDASGLGAQKCIALEGQTL